MVFAPHLSNTATNKKSLDSKTLSSLGAVYPPHFCGEHDKFSLGRNDSALGFFLRSVGGQILRKVMGGNTVKGGNLHLRRVPLVFVWMGLLHGIKGKKNYISIDPK